MKARTIVNDIYEVGIRDWTLHDFHGFATPRGVTYNSFLIMDEKICLIDGVKAPFAGEQLSNIRTIVDPEKIDYIVVNHVEPDHSGSLPALAQACPNATFLITVQGANELKEHYGDIFKTQIVKKGDTVSLGKRTLAFQPIPMLHWPDSMVTYCPEEQILFSSDAFGQHYCCSKLFDDETEVENMFFEAQKYFANILMPYRKLVPNTVKLVRSLPLKMICSCHGCIWRSHIDDILSRYESWGKGETVDRVLVVFDTMWGGTAAMARAMIKGIEKQGMRVKLYRYESSLKADIVSDLLTAKGILIGSPTQNSGMMPTIGGFLTYLKGLKPTGKKAAAFGTYGWAGGAEKDMEAMIKESGMELLPGYNVKWRPLPAELEAAEQYGYDFAEKVSKGE
ncbi:MULTISPECIES: FprA family A-type flavoprotein [Acidaminococcus]|jgi:flavorubredoxin|uniref:FprA family A-type flavoprotein n=1 Tax=Acidaminococcus fermentans TaxID=905 RepID=A0A6N7VJZ2_ACIFE|nr:FprA family A-type flavoprotein [Acidaminococcus fermentans]MSS81370.1 FprA family A-type flavoprotein [Acidaminococcus fermentans]